MSEIKKREIIKKIEALPSNKKEYLLGYMEGITQMAEKNKESKGE